MYKNLKEFTASKSFQGILIGIGISIVALLIFQAGVMVGQHRAQFGDQLGGHFERNFVDMERGGFSGPQGFGFGEPPLPGGHGAVGEIISVNLPTLVIAGPDNIEKTVIVDDDTLIREFRDELSAEGIEIGKFVVVLGEPNEDGVIEAKLLRFLPPPPDLISNVESTTE